MADNIMPATEANGGGYTDEVRSYELAFHVLPTVAEGEVGDTVSKVKSLIGEGGGKIFDEESPERIELVYPIVKHLEGKNRTFASAYFGWIRFTGEGGMMAHLEEELRATGTILRFLLVRLTKEAEAHPFKFHEHRTSLKMVEVIDEEAEVVKETLTEKEESAPVKDAELSASLEKITGEGDNSDTTKKKEDETA